MWLFSLPVRQSYPIYQPHHMTNFVIMTDTTCMTICLSVISFHKQSYDQTLTTKQYYNYNPSNNFLAGQNNFQGLFTRQQCATYASKDADILPVRRDMPLRKCPSRIRRTSCMELICYLTIPYSFNSMQWRQYRTQCVHFFNTHTWRFCVLVCLSTWSKLK